MNIGDYARTKKGIIGKIKAIDNQTELEDLYLVKRKWYYKEDIIKSSPNIIDLIEVGDILKFKDTKHYEEVEAIDDEKLYLTNYIYMSGLQEYKEEIQNDLEWVITHEQIESMKYEVE